MTMLLNRCKNLQWIPMTDDDWEWVNGKTVPSPKS
jgi:hypothetical protein